jgi:hypothetical protein
LNNFSLEKKVNLYVLRGYCQRLHVRVTVKGLHVRVTCQFTVKGLLSKVTCHQGYCQRLLCKGYNSRLQGYITHRTN